MSFQILQHSEFFRSAQTRLTFAVLALAVTAFLLFRYAPPWLMLEKLSISLNPGESMILGRTELTAPEAASRHVQISRDRNGGWRIGNIAERRKVLIRESDGEEYRRLRQWVFDPYNTFSIAGSRIHLLSSGPEGVSFQLESDTGLKNVESWRYDGFHLYRNGEPLAECGGSRVQRGKVYLQARYNALSKWLAGLHPALELELFSRPLWLGGQVYCGNRLHLPGVPARSLELFKQQDRFALRLGPNAKEAFQPVLIHRNSSEKSSLRGQERFLRPGNGLIIGRTEFKVGNAAGNLELDTVSRGGRLLPVQARGILADSLEFDWRRDQVSVDGLSLLLLGGGLSGLVLMCYWMLSLVLSKNGPLLERRRIFGLSLCVSIGALSLFMWILGGVEDLPEVLMLFFAGQLMFARLGAKTELLYWLKLCVILLLGLGVLVQLQFGLGARGAGAMRFVYSTAALGSAALWFSCGVSLAVRWGLFRLPATGFSAVITIFGLRLGKIDLPRLLLFLGCLVFALLIAQVIAGDETGVWGLQPFELAKLALLIFGAYALTRRVMVKNQDFGINPLYLWISYLFPVLIFVFLMLFALYVLHDHSPLLLLTVWALMIWVGYCWMLRNSLLRWGMVALLSVMLFAGMAFMAGLKQNPTGLAFLPQSDRIETWAVPEQYPHSGHQFLTARKFIREGGWTGADSVSSGEATHRGVNGPVMAIPAVQDDFMPAFMLHRYGGLPALAAAFLQLMLLLCLWRVAQNCRARTSGLRDYRLLLIGWFGYFFTLGGMALLLAHFMVSWGTNLGFLPVVGQPMPFLSSAGSHLLLFVMPVVCSAVVWEEVNYAKL